MIFRNKNYLVGYYLKLKVYKFLENLTGGEIEIADIEFKNSSIVIKLHYPLTDKSKCKVGCYLTDTFTGAFEEVYYLDGEKVIQKMLNVRRE